jgi:hypothetical protein
MKLPVLMSIGHNLADSLASGLSLIIGHFPTDIFAEAGASPGGTITVDFLEGKVSQGVASPSLRDCLVLYGEALSDFCARQGASSSDFAVLSAEFGTDPVYGRHFQVVVEDLKGRRAAQSYYGRPGKRLRRSGSR